MHPMFKNWQPKNQKQVDNTVRLVLAECPEDLPEVKKMAEARGFTVDENLEPATGWGSFR